MKKSLFLLILLLLVTSTSAYSKEITAWDKGKTYSIEQICNAIYLAEGGNKTSYPYGILKKFKNTTPRKACINTIKSNLKRWNGREDFIEFLGRSYCPIGAKNDPKGLNKNWVKNVRYYLKKGIQ
jgi:hypothetical protein